MVVNYHFRAPSDKLKPGVSNSGNLTQGIGFVGNVRPGKAYRGQMKQCQD